MNRYNAERSREQELDPLLSDDVLPLKRSNRIAFHDLPGCISRQDIENLCQTFGQVMKIEQPINDAPVNVMFNSSEEAERAVQNLNNQEYQGALLRVELSSKPRDPRSSKRPRSAGPPRNGGGWAPMRFPATHDSFRPVNGDLPLRMLIPTEMVGAVIGRGGTTIRQITNQTHARVDVLRKDSPGPQNVKEKLVTIFGTPESSTLACKEILVVLSAEAKTAGRQEPPLKILVGNQFCGRVIGRGGKTLQSIMEETNTSISISNQLYNSTGGSVYDYGMYDYGSLGTDRVITVSGADAESLSSAESLLSAKIKASHDRDVSKGAHNSYGGGPVGYGSMGRHDQYSNGYGSHGYYSQPMLPPFMPPRGSQNAVETTHVIVPHAAVGAIIGTKGANIREIINRSGAQIKIENKEESNPSLERRVTVTGTCVAQWYAQMMLSDCIRPEFYSQSQAYDEPAMHIEILVPKGLMGRVIGKQHCNLRDIRNVCGANVKIPDEEEQGEEVPVAIFAPFYANQFAQRRIRSLLATAQPRPGTSSPKELSNGSRAPRNGSFGAHFPQPIIQS